MAGLDSFLLLTPILMLAVVALLVFVGCDAVFGLHSTVLALNLEANPGIPGPNTRITPVDLTWNTESDTKIYRATLSAGPFAQIGVSDTGAYPDTTVTDGITYFYQVDAGSAGAQFIPVSATPQPPFVTGLNTLGAVLNNQFAFLGMAIHVGGNPLTVYALGRLMIPGNNMTHEILIVDASNNSAVASTVVNLAGGTPDSFVYAALPTPVTLNANADYYVVSLENPGGDQWHTNTTTVATTSVAAVTASIEGDGTNYHEQTPGTTYGPLDFLYL